MKMLSLAMAGAVLATSVGGTAVAAVIDWGRVISIDSSSDIYNPGASGELVLAVDFRGQEPSPHPLPFSPADDGMINGIPFEHRGPLLGLKDGVFVYTTNMFVGSECCFWDQDTDDADLDDLLDGHTIRQQPQSPGPASLNLLALTPGTTYSIQLIGLADYRPGLTDQTYEPDNGQGVFTGLAMRRGDAPSIRGIFTANSESQTIQINGMGGDEVNHPDPGLSGFVLFAVPEPCTGGLVALALGGLYCRRTR